MTSQISRYEENWITGTNEDSGICGFVSALCALYQHNSSIANTIRYATSIPKLEPGFSSKKLAEKTVHAEVASYLEFLFKESIKNENKVNPNLKEIIEFTKMFGDEYLTDETSKKNVLTNDIIILECAKFLINKNNDVASGTPRKNLGVGITPNAMIDYLKNTKYSKDTINNPKLLMRKSAKTNIFDPHRETILGVYSKNTTLPSNNDDYSENLKLLKHWIYYRPAEVYNYGQTHTTMNFLEIDFKNRFKSQIEYIERKDVTPQKIVFYNIVFAITWD